MKSQRIAKNSPEYAALHVVTNAMSVEAAIPFVWTWTEFTPAQRRAFISALSTFVRMSGRPPSAVLLTPAGIRQALPTRAASAYGLSTGRVRNVMSLVRGVMRRLGVMDPADRSFSTAWSAAFALLVPLQRTRMSAFARYCAGREIPPDRVDQQHLDAFEVYLTERTLEPQPSRFVGKLRGAWNRACASVAGWPGQAIGPSRRSHDYVLPLATFSVPLQAALKEFGEALSAFPFSTPFAMLDNDGARALAVQKRRRTSQSVRPITRALRENHARWLASAIVKTGVPIADLTSLACLVRPLSRPFAALEYLWTRAGQTSSAAGHHVAEVACMIGEHVGLAPSEVARLRNVAKQTVNLTYTGMTAKNEKRVRAMLVPEREAQFIFLPDVLMQAARRLRGAALKQGRSPLEAARMAFRATAIMLLSRLQLRVKNLCAIRLEHHLQRDDPYHGRIDHLTIPGSEMKGKKPILMPISEDLSACIEEWNRDFRPFLAAQGCRYLFPGHGTGDRPVTRQGMAAAIKATMEHHLGVALSPQQFRHLAAHMYLRAHPGEFETVRHLLAHASLDTTLRHYAGTQNEASMRRFDDFILAKRAMGQKR